MSGGVLEGTDGKWDTAGNWSSGSLPVTGDLGAIPNTLNNNVTDATGAAKTIDLAALVTHPGYIKSFGVSGTPILTAGDLIHVLGSGPFFFESHKNGGSSFITDEVRIEASTPNAKIEIGSDSADSPSNITRVNLFRGDVTLTGTIMFTDSGGIVVVDKIDGENDVTLTIVSTADILPDLIQRAGHSFVDNVLTRLTVSGGECVKDVNKATEIDVLQSGVLVYQHDAIAGEVLTCRVHTGGVLDLTQNSRLKVFDRVIRYRGGIIRRIKGLHTFTAFDDIEEEG